MSRILRRLGLNRLSALEPPAEPVRRYEREKPGELIHIDIKKPGKFNQIDRRTTGDLTDLALSGDGATVIGLRLTVVDQDTIEMDRSH